VANSRRGRIQVNIVPTALRASSYASDTMIVFTSDHGGYAGSHHDPPDGARRTSRIWCGGFVGTGPRQRAPENRPTAISHHGPAAGGARVMKGGSYLP